MCRACAEGGRRCSDGWSAEKALKMNKAASARRVRNRAIRRSFASTVGDSLGPEVKSAVMATSPNQLSLVASRIADHDPDTAEAMRTSVNGTYPGTHNMVVQEIRAESSYIDHDRTGGLKADPMNVTNAMPALNAVDAAALDKGLVPEEERDALTEELRIRETAVEMGLGNPMSTTPVTAEQAVFYSQLGIEDIANLGKPNERLENKLREDVFRNAQVSMSGRASNLNDDETYKTAEQIADGVAKWKLDQGYSVAEGVLLKRDKDGDLFYSVDGDFRLPASKHGFVHDEVAKIPVVGGITYGRFDAPAGQEAMFERLCNDPHTDSAVTEAAIRTAFASDRPAGSLVEPGEFFTFDEVPNPGKAGVTHTQMAATGHRRPGDFDPTSPASPVANRHLRRAGDVRAAVQRTYAQSQGVGDELDIRHERRASRAASASETAGVAKLRTPVKGDADYTARDESVVAGLVDYARKTGGKPARAAKHNGKLDTATFSRKPVKNQDVDLAVARANAYGAAGGPDLALVSGGQAAAAHETDTCDTAALTDYLKVSESVTSTATSRAVGRKSGSPAAAVTMASYTSVPEDTDISKVFETASSHSPTGFVAAASNARKPRRAPGTKTVRMVYTTANGAQVTPQRTIIGPEQTFRVASTTTDKLGVTTVHMVEDDVLSSADNEEK